MNMLNDGKSYSLLHLNLKIILRKYLGLLFSFSFLVNSTIQK